MTLRHLLWRLREEFYPEKHPYDDLTGCDTSGMMHRSRLGGDAEDYQAIDPDIFRACVGHIGDIEKDFSRFTFVDIGCGKGRPLLLAEEYGFRSIIGVELSGSLAKVATANAARIGSRRISVVHSDAREFQFPAGPLVVFFFNPFSGETLRIMMRNLARHTGELYVIYINPLHAEIVAEDPHLKVLPSDDWCMVWRRSENIF
jgi:SAM-dependent methyltransferase